MNLKEFFLSLAAHSQIVEIYFNEENRQGVFGFKINNIDSELVLEDNSILWSKIESEICNAFLSSDLIDDCEGDTSYFIQSDLSCIKTAKYFSWVSESDQFWIDRHETSFYFENIDFPFYRILINKELDSFKIDEAKTLKKILTNQKYEEFYSFYEGLLGEFQEMEIELQLEQDGKEVYCYINSMYGSYRENMNFTLLDSSEIDISKEELKLMLLNNFRIDTDLAVQVLDIKNKHNKT
ncbi:hypothetical protein N9O51_06120 [Saprospiraceae bacterium]|nr:hypothetical protein [Saprospiraceae bacterium]